jgi:hypothetical protein
VADFDAGFDTGALSRWDSSWQQAAGRFTAVMYRARHQANDQLARHYERPKNAEEG